LARKILLADDSVTAQNMGRKILADAGYEVITVNNGSAALKKIGEIRPDLIVLDVYMPGYSGLEVCQRLKEAGDTSRIPILLTVGKLEPFKPEEARRVRAEGFIVKPFEASELLSALAKLEDKMLPRSESSKPGRFARTIAAVEEGRYEKTSGSAEDAGWKNRIAFPSKKKEKTADKEEQDDSAIYNPLNKDLRTVLDPKAVSTQPTKTQEAKQETKDEVRVDLGALAPEGLPKDVTAEEIAALAAAAAQMQGKIADTKTFETKGSETSVTAQLAETKSAEIKTAETTLQETGSNAAPEKIAASAEAQPQSPAQEIAASQAITAAIAEPKAEETRRADDQLPKAEESTSATPFETDAPAASLATANLTAAISAPEHSGSEELTTASRQDTEARSDAAPATMAMGAAASHGGTTSRWTAVPVTLAPEESALALEDEMRKAYDASAPAESRPSDVSSPVEAQPHTDLSTRNSDAAETSSPTGTTPQSGSTTAAEPETVQPAATQIDSPVPEAVITETLHATVKNFETVSPAQVEPPSAPAATPHSDSSHSSDSNVSAPFADAITHSPSVEATHDEISLPQGTASEQHKPAEPHLREEFPVHPEPSGYESSTLPSETARFEEPSVSVVQATGPAEESSKICAPETQVSSTAAQADPILGADSAPRSDTAPSTESSSSGPRSGSSQEVDIATSTAAAWASWRRIRESGDSAPATHTPDKTEESAREAAMAVAAGAESAPGETPELASIVDSVLADLRPKIVEEISRKLGKKK
jgi:two-component system, chemotaxis family, chemotaxis protein CheY